MKLHRDLGITQKSAWYMAHRIREAFDTGNNMFVGPVEVDETYIGGKERHKHEWKKMNAGRGVVGKIAVVGIIDRGTNRVDASVVESTDASTLQKFVNTRTERDATVYTDDAPAYPGLPRPHETVKHSVSEFVRGQAHTNGIESFWSTLKRGYVGIYHHMSYKHLHRYVSEFSGRHNYRLTDTAKQMESMVRDAIGKCLRYTDLIGPKHTRQPRML